MILRQFLHFEPVVAASYVLGCGGKGLCAVVDPMEDVEQYLEAVAGTGMKIRYVIDTHLHADHVSGGRALAERAGAEYVIHADAGANYPFHGVHEGDVLELGNVQLQVLHTPGHTPEHISVLVTDRTRAPEPWFVATGHALMVGDMGRTELTTAAEEGARAQYDTAQKFKALPDYVEVLPGAFSGSVCGRALSGKPVSTIGFERRFNKAFQVDDRYEFIRRMIQEVPPAPPRALAIREVNLGLRNEVA